ncbi:myb-like transcription factor family protein [Perilla frutescens var. hirtella]|uniref:Myb-like transcription factor family protein n=1 Tax=Perilla frutescens var. hirtella TaxID=608512 RepID=A0AAD4JE87_PERFH|nr:myb-like transcription factor family protein [Perilla frutescens var. hirtella]
MTRRCSHCNGHNTRNCSPRCGGGGGGLKLFGVRLTNGSFIKKSASMGNLLHYSAAADSIQGYHSDDDLNHSFTRRQPIRKKGIPWSEEEHMQFLLGLHKLGRGNWRGISRNYVRSRTPTQVASHAQKYFIRQGNATGKKKRPSLFDLSPDMERNSSMPEQSTAIQSPALSANNEKITPSSSQGANINNSLPSLDLSLKLAITAFPCQIWQPNAYSIKDDGAKTPQHRMIRPMQANPEETMKELVGISHLTLGETSGVHIGSS